MNNTNYFILRNGKVAGPLDVQKLRSLFKEKRIQRGDKIANSNTGPWHDAAAVAKTLSKSDLTTISKFEFGKTMLGRRFAKFNCKKCKTSLKTFLDEYQEIDTCPECGLRFRLAGNAFETMHQEHEESRQAIQQAKDEKRQKKEALREEQARQKEEERQAKELVKAQAASAQAHFVNKAQSTPKNGDGVLRVQRPGNFVGALKQVKVAVDGVVLTKLKLNEQVDLTLSPGPHLLEVSGGGAFTGKRAEINVEPNAIQQYNIGYSAMGGLQLGLVGAAALTAGAIAEDGTLDVAIDLIASAVDVVETVADVVDVAEAASGLFDLFGD